MTDYTVILFYRVMLNLFTLKARLLMAGITKLSTHGLKHTLIIRAMGIVTPGARRLLYSTVQVLFFVLYLCLCMATITERFFCGTQLKLIIRDMRVMTSATLAICRRLMRHSPIKLIDIDRMTLLTKRTPGLNRAKRLCGVRRIMAVRTFTLGKRRVAKVTHKVFAVTGMRRMARQTISALYIILTMSRIQKPI